MDYNLISLVYPIVRAKIYPKSVVFQRKSKLKGKQRGGKRGKVRRLSQRSLDRLAFLALNTAVQFLSIQTLTYGLNFPFDGARVKADLNLYLSYIRGLRRADGCSYIWFLEFQKRGAPHIHILWSFLPDRFLRHRASMQWAILATKNVSRETIEERKKVYRVHMHNDSWEEVRSKDGAAKYALKYATKPQQKEVPPRFRNVGRFWGASRDIRENLPNPVEVDITELEARLLLVKEGSPMATAPFVPKYNYRRLK